MHTRLPTWATLYTMNASIINIGDELLIGQVVNTNATYMSRALTSIGIRVKEVCTIGDNSSAIQSTIERHLSLYNVVLVTGGLGPTKDDITKETLCRMFDSELYENAEALSNIERIFAQRGFTLTDTNRRQAWVPRCCTMINNDLGTAPCMWFDVSSQQPLNTLFGSQFAGVLVSLPGVPFEMEYLIDHKVIPMLKERFQLGTIINKNILVQGIGESFLSDRLETMEASLPENIKLAYLPQAGMIKLRLTAIGDDETSLRSQLSQAVRNIYSAASEYIVGEDFESLPEIVADKMRRHNLTLATAESCTGGKIASLLTAMPGASAYYKGGMVSYCDEVKHSALGVSVETLETHTAVSEETVREMAEGVRIRFKTDYAIATTGVAGPDGGSEVNPVGTVWIAVATPDKTFTKKCRFNGRRPQVIDRAVNEILATLARNINTNR